jgi:hypothetical protein
MFALKYAIQHAECEMQKVEAEMRFVDEQLQSASQLQELQEENAVSFSMKL